ncbi:unnamed protein product [Calypogeia fissa]
MAGPDVNAELSSSRRKVLAASRSLVLLVLRAAGDLITSRCFALLATVLPGSCADRSFPSRLILCSLAGVLGQFVLAVDADRWSPVVVAGTLIAAFLKVSNY